MFHILRVPAQSLLTASRLLLVLIVLLLLGLSILLFSAQGALRLGGGSSIDPGGVTNGSMINPDGGLLATGPGIDNNG